MSDVNISPNMNLPVPVVGEEIGPDWAEDINACMGAVDSHNHSSGQGVPITPDGININADLSMGEHNLTNIRTTNFTPQSAVLSLPTDIGCLYVVGVDLYYNDESGNQIRITQGGSVSGSSGTITGLPSGTASASFSGTTFSFKSSTNTPATMNVGPIVTGAASANPKTVTISASGSMPANYAMTWPTALPASTSVNTVDTSGNMGLVACTGSGNFVRDSGSTIDNATITNSALVDGQVINGSSTISGTVIDNWGITGSSVDSTPIGGTTPSTGVFTTLKFGSSGVNMKSINFVGTLSANQVITLISGGAYITLFGFVGITQVGGGAQYSNIVGNGDFVTLEQCIFENTSLGGTLRLRNTDSSNANDYNMTLFYI